ncbi:hypothetical protein OIU85_021279 [Salix viminalis]|uniref:Uncharacterized protein n=1 Tax=Salix viminalis TaxID=40686 RepID=A0A9Q0ZDL8_SALVM|nr:hypothetical protein OIU85_021279 [Salix viminalis]
MLLFQPPNNLLSYCLIRIKFHMVKLPEICKYHACQTLYIYYSKFCIQVCVTSPVACNIFQVNAHKRLNLINFQTIVLYRYQMMFCYEYCKGEPTLEKRQDMYNPKRIYKKLSEDEMEGIGLGVQRERKETNG